MSLKGKTIFVTGGSGFVGNRLIESLILDHGANVRALVNRAHAGALRMGRFDIEFVFDSILDQEAMKKATADCDTVFHLAYGKGGTSADMERITVEGTRSLAEASLENQVRRFVNVSTAAVYGNKIDGTIDEESPSVPWGWEYADTKLAAENIVMNLHKEKGFPATTMQVAGVYGPWGEVFTIQPLTQLKQGVVPLINGGTGVSNATFVDDVVQALLLGSLRDEAVGERFLVRGPGRVTRKEFYFAYEKMLGVDATVSMTLKEVAAYRKGQSKGAMKKIVPTAFAALKGHEGFKSSLRDSPIFPALKLVRRKLKRSSGSAKASPAQMPSTNAGTKDKPIFLPPDFYLKYLSAQTLYSNEKICDKLGFQPKYDLEAGMKVTEEWAKWARLI